MPNTRKLKKQTNKVRSTEMQIVFKEFSCIETAKV